MNVYSEWGRCPEVSCENQSGILFDSVPLGEEFFASFSCPECIASSLEDDKEYYLRCPNCHPDLEEVSYVDTVSVNAKESEILLECHSCGDTNTLHL